MLTKPPTSPFVRFLYENGLLLAGCALVLATLIGQVLTGWHEYNDKNPERGVMD